ncbi:type VI secretion system ImpA family N-terminal domain-containing protein [Gallibacterium anatis]|uniref:Type VI secretion system ImpA family N-terminal domain-containing protein n=3 Tax=Gallibacterium anatis TaxID=750 RepID=A0AAX3XEW2_9PAST|nr:type VI secretion system ImpA family N-terminal domain-containing protein [Gallibacterium anatis]MDK9431556.1 type VI secretion system ImpA family N-terminal domain-containing protein [Gallibacterium anatis]WIM80647.1 type VI secretion system ImpA family N-terminal domain-containing protein [Gallibacterium anatis]WIM80656.1 type VI secretion system ImpA family N-terminal domain-containing protein [Gallibacterium anatis]
MRLATSPSNLDEFIQIKEQINYLSRPDKQTDWKIVEKLSAHLLSENGTDLQTLVYFTVARYKLSSSFAQITKDIENIAIALISYWDVLWPLEVSNRITLLNWLNRQIADNIRIQVQSHQDIKALYCLDNALALIVEEIKKHSDLPINLNNLLVLVSEQIDKRVTSQYGKNIELIESTIVTSSPKPSLAQPKLAKVKAKEKSKPSEETNTPIKILRKTYLISLLFLMLGIILGGSSTYFYTEKYQKELQMKDELTQMLSSPTYLFKRGKAYIKSTNEQTLKTEWQNKIEYYENIGKTLVEPSKLRQQLNTLQQELLQAEKSRKGLTISYLKTALYDMEKELDSHFSLEQTLHIYADNPQDWEQKQRINKHFLSLLAYYAYLDDVESTKEKDKR